MSRYDLSPRCIEDISEISRYIGQDNPLAAARLVEQFQKAFRRLARNPQSGRARSDLRAGPRQVLVRPYLVLYPETDDGVLIVRCVHGRRNLPTIVIDD